MEILLVRHGMTADNREGRYIGRTDEPLLPEFCEILRRSKYRSFYPEIVYSSPLLRCRQTAEILFFDGAAEEKTELAKPNLRESDEKSFGRLVISENLREMDFGDFENKNYEELKDEPIYQEWINAGGQFAFPGGEEPDAFRRRCREAFEDCLADAGEKGAERIAFAVHGGTIMSIMEEYGTPKGDFYRWQVKNGEGIFLTLPAVDHKNF
ncbi:MAG: histidine phosphatase family protein [Clostridiales bacterium]|nr:histidine phosphatase family protein [Clostridiales bacterium]